MDRLRLLSASRRPSARRQKLVLRHRGPVRHSQGPVLPVSQLLAAGETTIHILPHWNWPDRVGQNVPVFVYTNGDSAELFLNGKSLGRRTKGVLPPKAPNVAQGKPATANPAPTRAWQSTATPRASGWRKPRAPTHGCKWISAPCSQ